jgi:hypothetical protein
MTPEQMQRLERDASLMAVAHSLTAAERVLFLGKVARRYPRLLGADVADVLDFTNDYDEFLDQTEPFFERFDAQMPDVPGVIFAAHVIIVMGWKLTPGRVWSLLQRAGAVDAPRYPEVEVGLWVHEHDLGGGPCTADANEALLRARAEQGLRAAGISESEITEFRESVRLRPGSLTLQLGLQWNVADIAKWVTLVDRFTEMPRKVYDPIHDLAVVLHWASAEPGDPDDQALANLRSHLDMRAPETIEASLNSFFGKEA